MMDTMEEETVEGNKNNDSEILPREYEHIAQKIYCYYETEKEVLRIAHSARQHKMCVER